ncbi:MAG: hypothetical protein Q9185_002760 [Variospora sp. 1 TL-2023]
MAGDSFISPAENIGKFLMSHDVQLRETAETTVSGSSKSGPRSALKRSGTSVKKKSYMMQTVKDRYPAARLQKRVDGVVKAKARSAIDVDEEAEKWETEFGAAAAQLIVKMVNEAMPDYEYLRAKRLRADT